MEEYHQITIQEYLDWKEDLRRRLAEAANNFVGIGYRLKQIRDSEAYRQDGYTSIFDFASKEYGISSSHLALSFVSFPSSLYSSASFNPFPLKL